MLRKALLVAATMSVLIGCGGSEPPTEQIVIGLEPFREAASVAALQSELLRVGVSVLEYRCGRQDLVNVPQEFQGAWVDGRTPRFLVLTVYGADAERARGIDYNGVLADGVDEFIGAHTPPYVCDPAVEASQRPFGGAG